MAAFLKRALNLSVPDDALRAEVLNLTRNVKIEGTPRGRAHIFIRSSSPQTLRHVEIRHMGPRQANDEDHTDFVAGRYGLHFHRCENGSRGSLVEGVVIAQTGSHCFVPHLSHGITFRECISYDTYEDAYWWDPAEGLTHEDIADPSHDIRYERCVAALIWSDPDFRGHRLTGFHLSAGEANSAVGCVSVGVQGGTLGAGYHWPERAHGLWRFEDCVAHNNRMNGISVWQNDELSHVVTRFTAYRNGASGIEHGAYRNIYRYQDSVLFDNVAGGVFLHAVSGSPGRLVFSSTVLDGPWPMATGQHRLEPGQSTLFRNCTFRPKGTPTVSIGIGDDEPIEQADLIDLVDCSLGEDDVVFADTTHSGSRVRTIEDGDVVAVLTP